MLRAYADEARSYLEDYPWCTGVRQLLYGVGVGGVVAVFLAELCVKGLEVQWLWVLAGELPAAYLPVEKAADPCAALRVYCDEVAVWVEEVRRGAASPRGLSPRAPATREVADELAVKLITVRRIVLPALCPCSADG